MGKTQGDTEQATELYIMHNEEEAAMCDESVPATTSSRDSLRLGSKRLSQLATIREDEPLLETIPGVLPSAQGSESLGDAEKNGALFLATKSKSSESSDSDVLFAEVGALPF